MTDQPQRDRPLADFERLALWPTLVWVGILILSVLGTFTLWRYDENTMDEHHVVETTQAFLLLMAYLVHSLRAVRREYRFDAWYRAGLAILCLSFAVRELQIDEFGPAPFWPSIELAIRGLVVVAWVVFIGLLVPRIDWLRGYVRQAFLSPCALFTLAGCVFYVMSWPFDKEKFPIDPSTSQYIEEMVELLATICLFAAATTTPAVRKAEDERLR
ncbi:hypothetical protein ACERK3_04715 [Phycisphaerales bacterium AB-hyl4]|uniref:Uncharacterized protein n=1 Tax=Natronomicrosphaera hydrolytica TaxID=3242702 RepID=A0ABV4U5M4_9BACT